MACASPLVLFATLLLTAAASAAETVTFGTRPAQPGDTAEQRVDVDMQMTATARRGEEILEQSESQIGRQQVRRVVATEIADGHVVAADVSFKSATRTAADGLYAEPVAGKTYRCRREGDELRVTTPQGELPPMAEYEIVSLAMRTLGTPSPLAELLGGRTVAVGEQIDVPGATASKLFGLDPKMGDVRRFTLKLAGVETLQITPDERQQVAEFDAEIEAHSAGSDQMRMIVTGAFRLDAATCRVVAADLTGPIALGGVRGGLTAGYQLSGAGKMRLALAVQYRDAR